MLVRTTTSQKLYPLNEIPLTRPFRFSLTAFSGCVLGRPYCPVKAGVPVVDGKIPVFDLVDHTINYATEAAIVIPLVESHPMVFTDDLSYHHDPVIMGCWREYTSD